MNNFVYSIIVLAYLVATIEAGCLSWLFSNARTVDFDGLENWLVERIPADENVDTNMAYMRHNMRQLRDPKTRRAADMLAGVLEATECDEHLLADLKVMSQANVKLGRERRVETLLSAALVRLNELCGRYIDQQVSKLYEESLSDNTTTTFLETVLPVDKYDRVILKYKPHSSFFSYLVNENDRSLNLPASKWARYLSKLATKDNETRNKVVVGGRKFNVQSREHFDWALNKYLLKPCRLLTTTLSQIFDGLYGLGRLQCPKSVSYEEFMSSRTLVVNYLMYEFKVCGALLASNKREIDDIYNSVDLKKSLHYNSYPKREDKRI